MPKLSKKLTNVIKVSGKSEKIEEFINKIKENEISILYFEIPNKVYCTKLLTSYIDKNWKVKNYEFTNEVILVKESSNRVSVIFSDAELEHILLETAEDLDLNISYKYFLDDKQRFMIATEIYKKGVLVDEKVSERLAINNYSVAFCII